jgi:hypothetical protein
MVKLLINNIAVGHITHNDSSGLIDIETCSIFRETIAKDISLVEVEDGFPLFKSNLAKLVSTILTVLNRYAFCTDEIAPRNKVEDAILMAINYPFKSTSFNHKSNGISLHIYQNHCMIHRGNFNFWGESLYVYFSTRKMFTEKCEFDVK